MNVDSLLRTFISSLQVYTDQQDTPRLLSTAASLLASLHHTENVKLVTQRLLAGPALWHRPDGGLALCLQIMGVFHTAARLVVTRVQRQHEQNKGRARTRSSAMDRGYLDDLTSLYGLDCDTWARAVMDGANDAAPRWKHSLVFAGLLYSFGERSDESEGTVHEYPRYRLSPRLLWQLEAAMVQSVNMTLADLEVTDNEFAAFTITLTIANVFPQLSPHHKAMLDMRLLLPTIIQSTFLSSQGLEGGYFVSAIDMDLHPTADGQLQWDPSSPSFQHMSTLSQRPLVMSLGMISRILTYAVHSAATSSSSPLATVTTILSLLDHLETFSRALLTQWRQNRMSNIHPRHLPAQFDPPTLLATQQHLWHSPLRAILYAATLILHEILTCVIGHHPALAADAHAPVIAVHALDILRNLYFVAVHFGAAATAAANVPANSTPFRFAFLVSIDILAHYPPAATAWLQRIHPGPHVATHRLDQTLTQFFLRAAEHFPLVLPPAVCARLLVPAAVPYIAAVSSASAAAQEIDVGMAALFEDAHCLMLAVLACCLLPQSSSSSSSSPPPPELYAQLPAYIDALFASFPGALDARQFRLAMRTVARVAAAISAAGAAGNDDDMLAHLQQILLDMLHHHATAGQSKDPSSPVRTTLLLALVDALPTLPPNGPLLPEYLDRAAALVAVPGTPDECRAQLRHVVAREMNAERSVVAVGWWTERMQEARS